MSAPPPAPTNTPNNPGKDKDTMPPPRDATPAAETEPRDKVCTPRPSCNYFLNLVKTKQRIRRTQRLALCIPKHWRNTRNQQGKARPSSASVLGYARSARAQNRITSNRHF